MVSEAGFDGFGDNVCCERCWRSGFLYRLPRKGMYVLSTLGVRLSDTMPCRARNYRLLRSSQETRIKKIGPAGIPQQAMQQLQQGITRH